MNWAYLAGFTDGDGCITRECAKNTYVYARVRWSQKAASSCVLDAIDAFLTAEGVSFFGRNYSVATKGHKYPQRELGLVGTPGTQIVLRAMLPYLVLKKQQATEALEILDQIAVFKAKYGNKYRRCLEKEDADALYRLQETYRAVKRPKRG